MGAKSGSHDAAVARLAGNQHGAIAVWQLLRLGLSRREIGTRVSAGWLHRVYRGVYTVGHPHLSREGQLMAAVLACSPDAVLSHWSAAEHWELIRMRRSLVAVSVAGHRRGQQGLQVHRLRQLDQRDRTRRDGIPITTVARTRDITAGPEPPASVPSLPQ